jgi:hypothetical protein
MSFGALQPKNKFITKVSAWPSLGTKDKRRLEDLPELFDLGQSSIDLVTHCRDNVIDGNHSLFVNEGLAPDLGIDLVASFQVLADIVFFLRDARESLAPVDVDARLRLAQHRTAMSTFQSRFNKESISKQLFE